MTDKVQKIRAEIERKMKTCEEAFNTCPSTAFGSRIDSYKALLSFIDSLPEKPVSEDLEEEINMYFKNWECYDNDTIIIKTETNYDYINFNDIKDIAHHFAEWQKHQMKEALQTEYEKGRFDMRMEMMKDAVDGEYWDGSIYLDNRPTEYKDGDEVKIIIVKEKQ